MHLIFAVLNDSKGAGDAPKKGAFFVPVYDIGGALPPCRVRNRYGAPFEVVKQRERVRRLFCTL